jgi:outer membrane protein
MKPFTFSNALVLTAIVLMAILIMAMAAKETAHVSRVGYASAGTLVKRLPETQAALIELDSLQKELTGEFNAKVGEFKTKASALERDKAKLSELVRTEREAELRTMQGSISKFQQRADSAYKANEQRLMKPLSEKVQQAIREVARQYGYTHILNTDSRDVPLMLYAEKATNTDSLVMLQLNKKK